ncbi:MAG: hypothetical protein GX684_04820, partial [Ruminococcaceae bacterium]|nr:hypothetical protein [Oscillospiraceae bacterium]
MESNTAAKRISAGAIARATAAIIMAVLLLTVTSFSFIKFLSGAKTVTSTEDLKEGAYVRLEIPRALAYTAESYSSAKKVTARFMIIPMEGRLLTIRLPERYFSSADEIIKQTNDMLTSGIHGNKYIVIEGTVSTMTQSAYDYSSKWVKENMSSLVGREIITSSENIEEYLSDFVINADHIGAFSSNFAITIYILTAILIIYALFEIFMPRKKIDDNTDIKSDSKAAEEEEEE